MNKIRILFVHDRLVCGGAEKALFELLSLMDPQKFQVTVLVHEEGGDWYDRFLEAGFRVVSFESGLLKGSGFFTRVLNHFKKVKIEKSMDQGGKDLIDVCLHEKFDIIVSFSTWDLPWCNFQKGAKSVKYIHGDVLTNAGYAQCIRNDGEVLDRYDRYLCVSELAKRSFMEFTGIRDRVSAHFNPMDDGRIKKLAQESVELPEDGPILCAVGRLSQEKGFERLLRIHGRLLREGIFHYLYVMGDGPERERLEQVIRQLHLEKTAVLVGYTDNPYPYMRASRFQVCPSYTEGLSLVALEGLSLGLPAVSSAPTVGELFGDENCGIITENDDESLYQGIRTMLTDRKVYEAARAGAEKRSAFFSGKRMVREVEEEFLSLVEGKE